MHSFLGCRISNASITRPSTDTFWSLIRIPNSFIPSPSLIRAFLYFFLVDSLQAGAGSEIPVIGSMIPLHRAGPHYKYRWYPQYHVSNWDGKEKPYHYMHSFLGCRISNASITRPSTDTFWSLIRIPNSFIPSPSLIRASWLWFPPCEEFLLERKELERGTAVVHEEIAFSALHMRLIAHLSACWQCRSKDLKA